MARLMLSKITVEPLLFLCMHVCFLTWVSFPQMILDNICLRKHNETRCATMLIGSYKADYDIVQKQSTLWFGGFLVIATSIAILTLPFVGTMSDQFGRYVAMFLTPVSQLLQALSLLGILMTSLKLPTWMLLLPGLIPGLVGDVGGLFVLTGSYVSDITSEKSRTLRITLLDCVTLVAGLSATLCSGFIIEEFGYVGIFVTNTASLVLALLYLIFCVKPVNHGKEKSHEQARIESQEVSLYLDKDEGKALIKNDESEVNPANEIVQELKTSGTNNHSSKYSVNEACKVLCTRNRTDESDFARREDTLDVWYGPKCDPTNNDVNGDKVSVNEIANAEKEASSNVGNSSMADCGVKEWKKKASVDINKGRAVEEAHLLSKTRRTKTSTCFSPEPRTVMQNEGDIMDDEVMEHIECQNANNNGQSLPIMIGIDYCKMTQIDKSDNRVGKGHGCCSPNFHKKLPVPQVDVISEVNCKKMPLHSQLLHVLKESNPLRNLKRVYNVLKAEGQVFKGLTLFLLIFLSAVCYSGEMSVMALFLKNRPYFLSARDLGFYFAYESGILAILGMAIFNYLFTRVIKIDDHLLLLVSFCFSTIYYILLSVAQSLIMLYLVQLVHSVGSLSTSVNRSLLSKIVPAPSTGLLFGALFMSETAGVLFGSLICPIVYSSVAVTYPGAVFFINGSLSLFSIFIMLFLIFKMKKKRSNNTNKRLDC